MESKRPMGAVSVNEWQVEGVMRAIGSLDRGEGVAHKEVKDWLNSWGRKPERKAPKHRPIDKAV